MGAEYLPRKPEPVARALCLSAFLIALVSCASAPEGPLEARMLPVEKRYEYAQSHGAGVNTQVRNAFMEGHVVPGMHREWVLQLYGRPDRVTERSWLYLDRKGRPVLEVSFGADTVDSVYQTTRAK